MSDKYSVNYEDERFKSVQNEQAQKVTETENLYDSMISDSDKYYQEQINASKDWANKQQEIQQQQTDFAVEKINQQKEQTQKDYIKEQKGAYSDWQKESNKYGTNAENLASSGLSNGGYAQSLQVSMWNTYQNRKASARESLNNAIQNYDNSIKEAQLANNSALAQIAANALQQELELSLQGFQYKNQLLQQKQSQVQSINDNYYNRYQNVLAQINAEIERQKEHDIWYEEFKENQRQYDEESALRKQEFALKQQQYEIENARAEKELQSALATEAAQRASIYADIGSTGSYSVNQNEGSLISESDNISGELSNNGKKILENIQKLNKIANSSTLGVSQIANKAVGNKENIRKYITQEYNKGQINDVDCELLFKQLGL